MAALALSFVILLVSVLRGMYILYPLLAMLIIFVLVHRRRGYSFSALLHLAWTGAQTSFPVLSILLLIGVLMAVWMSAGTMPLLVYYGLQVLHPQYFVVLAFGLTSAASVLLGTSFGAVGTMGLALMIMARGSAVSEHWVAGAIIAGAYVGDRCSPMSSSAHLIATLTHTDIYANLRKMIRTSWVPLLLSLGIYGGLSLQHPLQSTNQGVADAIALAFRIDGLALLPALVVLIMAALRLDVRLTMVTSGAIALALSLGWQHYGGLEVLRFVGLGYVYPDPGVLQAILVGGGLWSMGKVCAVVVVSTALARLLSGTQTFQWIDRWLNDYRHPQTLFFSTLLLSGITAAFGCTQTIAIVLTHQLAHPHYRAAAAEPDQLAMDLENTAVVVSPLVPWNIAGLVPATLLATDAGFIPFAVYLYLLPLWHGLMLLYGNRLHGKRLDGKKLD